jgi:hypothetical protein
LRQAAPLALLLLLVMGEAQGYSALLGPTGSLTYQAESKIPPQVVPPALAWIR